MQSCWKSWNYQLIMQNKNLFLVFYFQVLIFITLCCVFVLILLLLSDFDGELFLSFCRKSLTTPLQQKLEQHFIKVIIKKVAWWYFLKMFSVAKATLQSQISVHLSVCLSQKPFGLLIFYWLLYHYFIQMHKSQFKGLNTIMTPSQRP